MDSVVEDDITLPLDFDRSTNLAKFKEAVAATTGGDMLDSSSEFSEGLAVRPRTTAAASQDDPISPPTKTMRDYEYQISELKKENFGLKLRIYFLEERMNQALQDTPQDVFTANVELKVTVEKLKKELVEKQELLVKASNAVEAMAQHSELQVKQLTEEHNEELQEIREGYENKLKEIEKELTVARRDFEDVADKLTETVNLNHQLNEKLMENTEGFHEDQRQLEVAAKATLDEKDQMIDDLRDENETLKDHVKELRELLDNQEQDGHQKKAVDANKDKIEECEKEIKQLTEQLNSRQRKVEELMEQTKKVERANKNLRNQLHDREVELKSRNPMNTSLSQNQKDGTGSKDSEVQKLNTKIQDLEQSLTATRESAHSAKSKWYQANEEHEELLRARDSIIAALQSSLSAKDLEMEKMIRSISAKEVEFQRVNNGKPLLEQRFDEMLKQKDRELAELMEKLKSLSQEHCSKMDALEEACQQVSAGAQEQLEKKDKIIQKLAENNKEKDAFLGDLLDALKEAGSLDNSGVKNHPESQDSFVKNLRKHLKDKDSAVEVAIEEKQRAEQGKEAELQQLRQALRERDRLIEKINSAVLESEERKKLLESSCKEKDEALQRLAASLEDEQKTQKETFESTAASLKEKEAVIQTLNNNLTNRDRELKELKDFVKNALNTPGEEEVSDDETKKAQELSDLLKQKEKLLEDMFQERSRMSSAHEASSQRLIGVLRDKEAAVKEVSNDLTRVQTEKNATIQRLQQLLNSKDHELQALENSKTWASQEHDKLLNKLQMIIQDKDKTIESLVESVREKDKMLHKLNAELRRNIDQLQAEIQEKDESSKKLELEYKANLTRLQENEGEKNMKLQSLAHEMQTRDALLKQAQGTIENLRARLQSMPKIEELQQKFAEQTMALAEAQKSKEQAFVDSAAVQKSNLALEAELKSKLNSMDMLTESAQMKDNIIQEMQEDQQRQIKDMKENITYYRNKAQELETSNNQLRQSLMQVEDAKNGLENQLESYKRRLSSRATYSEEEVNLLRQEVTNLKARLQRPGTPRRESPCVGAGAEEQKPDVLQLQQMLDAQISETKRLHNILATERALYGELATAVQETMQGTRSESKVQEEMQTLKSLRAQLEEGIRQNETLRGELRDKLAFTNTKSSHPLSPYDVAYQREIQELKSKLEDSERWNASLQARLNESRVSGVGGSSAIRDSGDGVTAGAASPTKVQWLQQQLEILKNQLQQSIQFNSRLKNQLDEVNSLNVQTIADKDHVIQDLTRQIEHLQSQLDKTRQTFGDVEARLADANAKLECYASNLNGSYEETLLEREQELETLKLQLEELRRNQTDKRIIADIGAQTSPAKDWDYLPSGEVRELEQRLKESRTANERYKQMLEEKVNELKWLKHKNAAKAKDEKDAKMREMAEIEHLRKEYKAGIVTNEELRRHLESERDKSTTSDNVSELHLKLDESLQGNDILERQLDEISRSEGEVNRLRRELQTASQLNDSLGTRIRELNESMSRMKETGNEVARLQKERNDARRLNKTLSDQLKETRKSAEEVGRVQVELREAKAINGQLGKQLADLLNHSAQMKGQLEKLQHELQEREKVVETLQLRLQSKAQMQSRALSPFSPMSASSPSPTKRFVDVQTSPVFNLASPPQVTRVVIPTGSPQNETISEATEKMHQLNRMLLGENQLLRSKLKDSERLNATLKEENNMFSKLHSQSTQTQDAQLKRSAPDDLLATYMAEMRELRMRLEDSIRTNDALRAQMEKRLSEGTGEGKSEEGPEKIVLIRENDSLRTELLEKDRTNEKLKRTVDELRHQRTRDKEQINLLRQQFVESSKALENLKQELAVYEKLYNLSADGKATEVQTDGPSYGKEGPRSPTRELENNAVALLLAEIRSLRVQLEKSIQTNNALRLKLEEQFRRPMASPSQSPRRSQTTVVRQLNFPEGRRGEKFDSAQGAGSDAAGGQDVVDQLKDKLTVINQVATIAYHRLKSNAETNTILSQIENILRIVLECNALLETFHADASSQRASGNSVDTDGQNKSLKLEIAKLRRRLLVQEDIIKRACERLEDTKEAKERMRSEIVQQLSLTQNVMSSARCKLEDRGQKDE